MQQSWELAQKQLGSAASRLALIIWLGHADINTTHIYLEIDMEMKRRIIEKLDAPAINERAPWHKPGIIEWLNTLGSGSGLCEVNPGRMKRYERLGAVNFT